MMFVFGNDTKMRGCFSTFNLFTKGGRGARITLPGSSTGDFPGQLSTGVPTTGVDPIVVTGVNYAQKEKIHVVQCFSDYAYAYAFGHDPLTSLLEVQFVAFLVASDGENWSEIPDTFNAHYKRNRVVETPQYAKVFLGSAKPIRGFIVGMRSGTADAHHNLQNFSMTLQLAEAQG